MVTKVGRPHFLLIDLISWILTFNNHSDRKFVKVIVEMEQQDEDERRTCVSQDTYEREGLRCDQKRSWVLFQSKRGDVNSAAEL